jgi:hypothetical protein
METITNQITIKESIFANITCKGGVALLVGQVVKETEKAIQIHYALEPVFASGCSSVIFANRSAWVPKSQVVADGRGAWEIKKWFANNALKSFNIKPYQI